MKDEPNATHGGDWFDYLSPHSTAKTEESLKMLRDCVPKLLSFW